MGNQFIRKNGIWTQVSRPYVKRGGIWTGVQESWVKRSGAWVQAYQYDTTPPSVPEMALQVIDNRYILVSVRLPDTGNDPTLKRIRVLVSNSAMPTSPTGAGGVSTSDANFPNEAWSNFWFNHSDPSTDHGDSSLFTHKEYPPNPTKATNLPGGRYYYFAAWAQDLEDNWSRGVYMQIWMPKEGSQAAKVIKKEMYADPTNSGSLDITGAYTEGILKINNSPRSNGMVYYGGQFVDSVGRNGPPTITAAAIRVSRRNDAGQPQANVRVGWTDNTGGAYDISTLNNVTVLGTIQKGETKWFDLPTSWNSHYHTDIRGIGVKFGTSATDDLELKDLGADMHCGWVHLNWTEDTT